MKVILLKDIAKVGRKYEVKNVSDGYAINLLIPKGDAIAATANALKQIEAEKKRSEGERKVMEELILKNLKDLDGIELTITEKTNDKGHLFAGLHKEEIAKEIEKQTQLQIDPNFIVLEHPIKEVGEHKIEVKAHEKGIEKSVKFKLIVKSK